MIEVIVWLLASQRCVDASFSPDLVTWNGSSYRVLTGRPDAIEALDGLFSDLEGKGLKPVLVSGYRSYDHQVTLHTLDPEWTEVPGCSQHQLGTAFDIGWMGYGLRSPYNDLLWSALSKFGSEHGFHITYTGIGDIPSEPWHLNYRPIFQRLPSRMLMHKLVL